MMRRLEELEFPKGQQSRTMSTCKPQDYKPKHSMGALKSLNCYVATPAQQSQKGVILFADMLLDSC